MRFLENVADTYLAERERQVLTGTTSVCQCSWCEAGRAAVSAVYDETS